MRTRRGRQRGHGREANGIGYPGDADVALPRYSNGREVGPITVRSVGSNPTRGTPQDLSEVRAARLGACTDLDLRRAAHVGAGLRGAAAPTPSAAALGVAVQRSGTGATTGLSPRIRARTAAARGCRATVAARSTPPCSASTSATAACHELRARASSRCASLLRAPTQDIITECDLRSEPSTGASRSIRVRRTGLRRSSRTVEPVARLFPQHGPGRKHERPIVLAAWQDEVVRAHPGHFLRGLLHSDGAGQQLDDPLGGRATPPLRVPAVSSPMRPRTSTICAGGPSTCSRSPTPGLRLAAAPSQGRTRSPVSTSTSDQS